MDDEDTGESAAPDDAAIVAGAVDGGGGDQGGDPGGTETPAGWNHAEGVAGTGDVPEWFKADKYATVADQAKAYKDLEGKFGSFTGAPEEYADVVLSDEMKEAGIEFAADDPMMDEAKKFAKEAGMDQAGFEKMVNLYAMSQAAEQKHVEEFRAEEMKSLGNNAETRVNNLNAWASANLPSELIPGFQAMAGSAEAVKAMERMVAMTRAAPIAADGTAPASGPTGEDVRKMQFEKDEHGNRRIQTDPEFRKRYNKLANDVYGAGDHMVTIGG